jgi:hypothetical protein
VGKRRDFSKLVMGKECPGSKSPRQLNKPIAGWTVLPFLGSIVAIITGHMAKGEISRSGGTVTGGGMATFGLILGYLAVVGGICLFCIAVVLPLVGITIIPWDSIISSINP